VTRGEGDRWREAVAAEMPLLKEGRGWQWSWVQKKYGASRLVEEVEKMW
jgi:hypothetical protein